MEYVTAARDDHTMSSTAPRFTLTGRPRHKWVACPCGKIYPAVWI